MQGLRKASGEAVDRRPWKIEQFGGGKSGLQTSTGTQARNESLHRQDDMLQLWTKLDRREGEFRTLMMFDLACENVTEYWIILFYVRPPCKALPVPACFCKEEINDKL